MLNANLANINESDNNFIPPPPPHLPPPPPPPPLFGASNSMNTDNFADVFGFQNSNQVQNQAYFGQVQQQMPMMQQQMPMMQQQAFSNVPMNSMMMNQAPPSVMNQSSSSAFRNSNSVRNQLPVPGVFGSAPPPPPGMAPSNDLLFFDNN